MGFVVIGHLVSPIFSGEEIKRQMLKTAVKHPECGQKHNVTTLGLSQTRTTQQHPFLSVMAW